MRKNHSKIVCIKLVHLPYLLLNCVVPSLCFLGNLTAGLGVGSTGGWGGGSKPTTPMNGTPRAGSPINHTYSPQHRPASWTPQVNMSSVYDTAT